jgi:hypothetical protein
MRAVEFSYYYLFFRGTRVGEGTEGPSEGPFFLSFVFPLATYPFGIEACNENLSIYLSRGG